MCLWTAGGKQGGKIHTVLGRPYKLHAERPRPDVGFEPKTFLLWDSSAKHHTIMLPLIWKTQNKCFNKTRVRFALGDGGISPTLVYMSPPLLNYSLSPVGIEICRSTLVCQIIFRYLLTLKVWKSAAELSKWNSFFLMSSDLRVCVKEGKKASSQIITNSILTKIILNLSPTTMNTSVITDT